MTKPLTPKEYQHWKYTGLMDGDTIDRFAATLDFLFSANSNFLEVLAGITEIDIVRRGPLQGAIIVGPQGWRIAQKTIKKAEEKKE